MSNAVKINGNALSVYSADAVSYYVGACSITNGYVLPYSKIIPVILKGKIGLRKVSLTLDFSGTEKEIADNIRSVTKELQGKSNISLPDEYDYWCVLESIGNPKVKAPWIKQVEFILSGVRHGPISSFQFTAGSRQITAVGDLPSPAIISISGSSPITFNGITITGATGTVEIDGIETTVTDSNGNAFGKTNMTEWPKLSPGANTISTTGSGTIAYYPIYL